MLTLELERGSDKLRADGPELEALKNADPRKGNLSPSTFAQIWSFPYEAPEAGNKPNAISNLGIAVLPSAVTFLNTVSIFPPTVVEIFAPLIFNVPVVPGSTNVPSGIMAFHSVLAADISQSSFMQLP